MSIEQSLDRIAGALESLAANAKRLATPEADKPMTATEFLASKPSLSDLPGTPLNIPGATAPRPRGRPPGSTKTETPVAVPTQAAAVPVVVATQEPVGEADPFGGEAATDKPALTEGDVRVALQALKDRKGRTTEVFKLLKDIGSVDTLPKLEAKFYARVIAAAKAIV